MSEVEKMYENAGVKKIEIKRCSGIKQSICLHNCNECESFDYKYSPFTAEKQLSLIKWLAIKYKNIGIRHTDYIKGKWQIFEIATYECYSEDNGSTDFGEVLANLINKLLQSLTEQERTEIAEILRG